LFFWDKLDQDSRTYFKSPNYCQSRFRKRDISYQYPVQVQEKEGADYVTRSRQCNVHYNVKAAGLVRLDQNGGWTFVKKMDGTYKNAEIINFISSTLIDVTYATRNRYSNDLPDYAEASCTITPQQQATANLSELQFDVRDAEKAFYRIVIMINNPLETQQGEINSGQPLAPSSLAVAVDDVSGSVLTTIERHARCLASNKKILMQQQRTPKLE
jgi:hypothetical protein